LTRRAIALLLILDTLGRVSRLSDIRAKAAKHKHAPEGTEIRVALGFLDTAMDAGTQGSH